MYSLTMEEKVDRTLSKQLSGLGALADCLVERVGHTRIVPIVGAGASVSAGIPTFRALKAKVYDRLVGSSGPAGDVARLLDAEAKSLHAHKDQRSILDLQPFEFMAVTSRFQHGRDAIHDV